MLMSNRMPQAFGGATSQPTVASDEFAAVYERRLLTEKPEYHEAGRRLVRDRLLRTWRSSPAPSKWLVMGI